MSLEARSPTPLMGQWERLKAQVPEAWLFFRLGDFYELFGPDAEAAWSVLNVQLTSRDGQVPMCGVPHHALDLYLDRAVRSGHSVAIAEQLEDPKDAKGLVDRGIVRLVTPGTYVPDDGETAGPVTALYRVTGGFGLAAVWLGEGRAVATEYRGRDADACLRREWDRLAPAECVVPDAESTDALERIDAPTIRPDLFYGRQARRLLLDRLQIESLRGIGLDDMPWAQAALLAALKYIDGTQGSVARHVTRIVARPPGDGFHAESRTLRQLAILDASHPDLYRYLNQTVTPMGARLLRDWLVRPLADAALITERLDAVAYWCGEGARRQRLRDALKPIGDIDRRVARLTMGLGQPRDLLRLKAALQQRAPVLEILAGTPASARPWREWPQLNALAERLNWMADEVPATWDGAPLIAAGTFSELDRLRELAQDQRRALLQLEQQLRQATDIRTLKVGVHRTLGYYVEVSRTHTDKVPASWRRKQSMVNTERYSVEDLDLLASDIERADADWHAMEAARAQDVLAAVTTHADALNGWAESLAIMDVILTWAEVAERRHWVRPAFSPEGFRVSGVRHALVEQSVDSYVRSDLQLETPARAAIITGPNMAGKSTFMRAIAQNAWLAQVGSFVAAEQWSMPLLDGIWVRIGADDDLTRGQSTFMVEMEEMAQILQASTARSLVILDELGRGTSTFDGMAIAWAVLEHLGEMEGPWTLFATHYQELTNLEGPTIINLAVDAVETQGRLVLLHQVKPGKASRSFGIAVAAMAGLPRPVIARAERLQRQWEREGRPSPPPDQDQVNWFEPDPTWLDLLSELRRLDTTRITPMEALNLIAEWQRRVP